MPLSEVITIDMKDEFRARDFYDQIYIKNKNY